jgi:hypothetical protein
MKNARFILFAPCGFPTKKLEKTAQLIFDGEGKFTFMSRKREIEHILNKNVLVWIFELLPLRAQWSENLEALRDEHHAPACPHFRDSFPAPFFNY